jgi:hypothetical protein
MASLLAPAPGSAEPELGTAAPSLEFLLFLAESESTDSELVTPIDLADMGEAENDETPTLPAALEEDAQ